MGSGGKSAKNKNGKINSSANAYPVPHGIEVLVKKASVDAKFRELLLTKRAEAAKEIDLELDQNEVEMLIAIPREQLEKIIDNTKVSPGQKKVFLSSVGKIMLATVITGTVAVGLFTPSLGHTLTPEQYERIKLNQEEYLKQMQDMNEPNEVDSQAEENSNGQ